MAKLNRTLSLQDAISIVAGSMIGSGIFIVSADISRQVNNAWLVIIVWLLAGFITFCGALCYGELSSSIPDEGGQYIYLKKIFSEKLAFIYGLTLFLVIQTGTLAAVNIAFAKFLGLIFPYLSSTNYIFLNISTQQLFAVLVVILLTFVNSRGVKQGILVQNLFTITKILSILAIIICGIFFGAKFSTISQNFSFSNINFSFDYNLIRILLVAIVGALFSSITWNNVTFITSEIKKPKRNIPKALIIGTLLVISLYFLINMVYLSTLPLELIKTANEDIVAATLINQIFGEKAKIFIATIIAISAFGCANGMILTGSRVYYKMAKDKIFFRKLAYINRRTKVPENSLWLQCLWICILILWGNYSQLLDYVIYASLIFYIITIAGIFKLRKEITLTRKIFRIPTFFPVAFLILSSLVIIALTFYKPLYTLPGLLITLLGFPVYDLWKKNKK
ncbi:MAG: amino acid permease [Cyanobacteria bacterium SIG30]|nr:amino acid permease [Cyanobacteria bacterium SIG30]